MSLWILSSFVAGLGKEARLQSATSVHFHCKDDLVFLQVLFPITLSPRVFRCHMFGWSWFIVAMRIFKKEDVSVRKDET